MLTGSKLRVALEDVEHVIIDEVHELAASKRGAQMTVAMERVQELSGPFQRIGLSATVGDPEEVGKFLTGGEACEIIEVDVGSRLNVDVVQPSVTEEDQRLASELVTDAEVASHVRYIADLIEANESVLLFVNTRQTAEALGSRFKELGTNIGVHHGSLSKEARIDVEDAFKDGEAGRAALYLLDGTGHRRRARRPRDPVRQPRQVSRLLQRVGRAGHRRDLVSSGTVVTTHADDTLEGWPSPGRRWTATSSPPASTTGASTRSPTRSRG